MTRLTCKFTRTSERNVGHIRFFPPKLAVYVHQFRVSCVNAPANALRINLFVSSLINEAYCRLISCCIFLRNALVRRVCLVDK